MSRDLSRRDFSKAVAATAGLSLVPVPTLGFDPVKRTGGSRMKLSLAAYSFRNYLTDYRRGNTPKPGAMTLESFVDLCAQYPLDGVELTSVLRARTDAGRLSPAAATARLPAGAHRLWHRHRQHVHAPAWREARRADGVHEALDRSRGRAGRADHPHLRGRRAEGHHRGASAAVVRRGHPGGVCLRGHARRHSGTREPRRHRRHRRRSCCRSSRTWTPSGSA